MKKIILFCFIVILAQPVLAQREFKMTEGDTTYIMKEYYLVLLKSNPEKNALDSMKVQAIQQAHLANINTLAEMGKIVMAGPMGDDGTLRGIFVMDCKSLQEADSLVQTDPAIKANRLIFEIHPWWAAKGSKLP